MSLTKKLKSLIKRKGVGEHTQWMAASDVTSGAIVSIPWMVGKKGIATAICYGQALFISPETVARLNAGLAKNNENNAIAYLDYNHECGVSAGAVTGFTWVENGDDTAIYATVELSDKGAEDIAGLTWNYTSARFLYDYNMEIIDCNYPNVLALCNNPANDGQKPLKDLELTADDNQKELDRIIAESDSAAVEFQTKLTTAELTITETKLELETLKAEFAKEKEAKEKAEAELTASKDKSIEDIKAAELTARNAANAILVKAGLVQTEAELTGLDEAAILERIAATPGRYTGEPMVVNGNGSGSLKALYAKHDKLVKEGANSNVLNDIIHQIRNVEKNTQK